MAVLEIKPTYAQDGAARRWCYLYRAIDSAGATIVRVAEAPHECEPRMKIEYKIPCRQKLPPPAFGIEHPSEPHGRAPRIARLLALAHKLDGLVRSGAVRDYAELARLGHVSAARVSQIMTLLHLASAIQEYLLVSLR